MTDEEFNADFARQLAERANAKGGRIMLGVLGRVARGGTIQLGTAQPQDATRADVLTLLRAVLAHVESLTDAEFAAHPEG